MGDHLMNAIIVVGIALFTDGFLYGLVIPLIPHLLGASIEDWMFGVTSASYALGVMLAIPYFALVSDRVGRRNPLLWGGFFQVVSTLIFASSTFLPLIVFARLAQGIASAATWTIGLAIVAERYQRNRAQMMGYAMLANTMGLILGPLMGGMFCDLYGHSCAFTIVAALSCFDFLVRWRVTEQTPRRRSSKSELSKLLFAPSVFSACVIVILAAWCWSILESLLPNYLEKVFQTSSTTVGLIFTISSILYGVCCPLVGSLTDRYGSSPMMIPGLIAMAVILVLIGLPTGLLEIGILLSLMSVAYGFAMDPALSALGTAVERHGNGAYALIYGVFNIAYSIGMMTSDLSSGILASLFSFPFALCSTGMSMLLGLLFFKLRERKPSIALQKIE